MNRRHMLGGLAASAFIMSQTEAATNSNTYLELKTWFLHNSDEQQGTRVADFLEHGMGPALSRAGAKPIGAFGNLIGPNGPYYVTLTEYASLAAMQEALEKLRSDDAYKHASEKLNSGTGLPFVRIESSLLRSFDGMPRPAIPQDAQNRKARIFELRTYESQTLTTLQRKIGMFNNGEMQIFERLGMRPVFFGEVIVGTKQPCLTYMLSFDSLAERERLWGLFGKDPAWVKLRSQPGLTDPEIVENINNIMLRALPFSAIK